MKDILYAFTHFGEYPWVSLTLVLMFLTYIGILVLQIINNKNVLLISVILGLIVGLYYLLVSTLMKENIVNGIDQSQKVADSIYMWLTMAWTIFMMVLLSILPIYIFTMVSTTFTNTRHHHGSKRLITTSFISLWAMTFLGIGISLLLAPFMFLLKDGLQLQGSLAGQDATGIFGGIWPELERIINKILVNYGIIVLISMALAFVFALIMNILHSYAHDWGEKIIRFLERVKEGMRLLLHWVAYMVPYVISGMLIVLFANYQNAFLGTLNSLLLFTMFFFIGLFIVWGLEYGIVLSMRPNKNEVTTKELNKTTREYALNDFAVQSAPILYPITVKYVAGLGVHPEVVDTTPTLSTFMGYSMCGGFYPALIVIFTILQGEPMLNGSVMSLTLALILISVMIPLILIMTLGMTGVPGADVAIILGLLSTLGLNPSYFFTIYLIEPMLDKFRGIGNSMGFAAASVITDKVNKKHLQNYKEIEKE